MSRYDVQIRIVASIRRPEAFAARVVAHVKALDGADHARIIIR
jgi:hypothetical protein